MHKGQSLSQPICLKPKDDSPTLFAISFLSSYARINHQFRLRIAAAVKPFDIRSPKGAMAELDRAFLATEAGPFLRRTVRADELSLAVRRVEQWINEGIFLIYREDLRAPFSELHSLPPFFFARGDPAILEKPVFSIHSSRRSRRIVPDDPWLLTVKKHVQTAIGRGFVPATSYGTPAYCLVSALAKESTAAVVCPEVLPFLTNTMRHEQFLSEYGDMFDVSHTLFLSSFPPGTQPPKPQRLLERDHIIAALSSELHGIDVRPGGNMDAVLSGATKRKATVIMHEISDRTANPAQDGPIGSPRRKRTVGRPESLPREGTIGSETPPSWDQSIFFYHYTRSCPGAWPGQTVAAYWKSLIDGDRDAGHAAFDTLSRILRQGVIRANNKLTRGNTRVVCFSACEPSALHSLIKWRPGLMRWQLEPYAIGIRRDCLLRMGARQVIYGEQSDYRTMPDDRKSLFQIRKTSGTDWTLEKEWRVVGDIVLDAFNPSDVVVVVANTQEAQLLRPIVRFRVESLAYGNGQLL